MNAPQPALLIVMGVSGCGKSTLAAALGAALGLRMIDGDDLHLPESVRKMAAGVALSDADRWPWLDRVGASLLDTGAPGQALRGTVIACSALKRVYRDRLRQRAPGLRFVYLDAQAELLQQRMAQRTGHFMHTQLLQSQLNTLEKPKPDEKDVLTMNADQPLAQQVAQVAQTWFADLGAHVGETR